MLALTSVVLQVQPTEVLQRSNGEWVPNPLRPVAVLPVKPDHRLSSFQDDVPKETKGPSGGPRECACLVRRVEARGHVGKPVDRDVNF